MLGAMRAVIPSDDPRLSAYLDDNPLRDGWSLPDGGTDVVLWSGTLGDGLFDAHPHTWLGPGRASLDARCAEIDPVLRASERRIVFLPHARHVLSDPPSCREFVAAHADGPFGIALAPARLFEPSMIDDAEDHLVRMVEAIGPLCSMLWLEDVDRTPDGCAIVPLGAGGLPLELLVTLIQRHVPPNVAAVLPAAAPSIVDSLQS